MKIKFKVGDRISFHDIDGRITGTIINISGGYLSVERDDGRGGAGVDGSWSLPHDYEAFLLSRNVFSGERSRKYV